MYRPYTVSVRGMKSESKYEMQLKQLDVQRQNQFTIHSIDCVVTETLVPCYMGHVQCDTILQRPEADSQRRIELVFTFQV